MAEIYVDGSGFNGIESKFCIVVNEKEPIIKSFKEKRTSNEMEYSALLEALSFYAKEGDTIYTDSQLMLGHLTRGWKQNYPHLKPLIEKCKKLLDENKILLVWIPREQNKAGKILER